MAQNKLITWLTFLLAFSPYLHGQIQSFEIQTGKYERLPFPIRIPLNDFPINDDSLVVKVWTVQGDERIYLKNQIDPSFPPSLWVLPNQKIPAQSNLILKMSIEKGIDSTYNNRVIIDDKNIRLSAGDKKVLNYRHAFYPAPEGVNPIYGKSGFIHPLYSPAGNILTTIQPDDHYHHYGVWNPWTKVQVEGQEIDFWNLGDGEGTVAYAGLISKTYGNIFSGFTLRQEHINYKAKGADKVSLNEIWEVKNFPIELAGKTCWLIDFTSTLNNALDSKIEFTNYRYGGGISIRTNEYWTNQNSKVLTSEGKTRKDADGSRARWCKIEGDFPDGSHSGMVFMSHPSNREHPEPMRVWPLNANQGRGDLFFEFCPIRHQKWDILPGKDYKMHYRILIFDGNLPAEIAEAAWQSFARPLPVIRVSE